MIFFVSVTWGPLTVTGLLGWNFFFLFKKLSIQA